jgi:Flp pilus assembly protein TadG
VLRRIRDSKGNTMLEAAIITPLLLLLTFSIIDFGALFYVYLALENGVSQATRYGITGAVMDDPLNPGTPLSRTSSIQLAMRQATPGLTIPDTAFTFQNRPSTPGGAWVGGVGGPNDIGKVTVNYNWTLFCPLLRPFFPGGVVSLKVDSVMKNEGVAP